MLGARICPSGEVVVDEEMCVCEHKEDDEAMEKWGMRLGAMADL